MPETPNPTKSADAGIDRETSRTLDVRMNEHGLVPGIVQDADSGEVLMMAWMNEEALRRTLTDRRATFYSRSRNKVWAKGEESGHVMELIEARVDCDQDVVLLRCKPLGPACHAGYRSCFYRSTNAAGELRFVERKVFDPEAVYKK